jgi:hypothetical protein
MLTFHLCAHLSGVQTGLLTLTNPGPYGNDIQSAKLEVFYVTKQILRVKITDGASKRWEGAFLFPSLLLFMDTSLTA